MNVDVTACFFYFPPPVVKFGNAPSALLCQLRVIGWGKPGVQGENLGLIDPQ